MKSATKIIPPLEQGVIKRWQVSTGFSEKDLDHKVLLQSDEIKNLTWQTIGFPKQKKMFEGLIVQDRLSHAYILEGPEQIGK